MDEQRTNHQNTEHSPEADMHVSKKEQEIIMAYIQGNISESELRYHLQDQSSFERFLDRFTTS